MLVTLCNLAFDKIKVSRTPHYDVDDVFTQILYSGAKIWILSSSGENNILRMSVANE